MAIAVTPGEWDHVPKADRTLPPEHQTHFTLRTLSAREDADLDDLVEVNNGKAKMPIGARVLSTLRIGLKGWRNFRDAKGQEIAFAPPEQGMCAWTNLDRLSSALRHELASVIETGNELSEADRKN